jgi:hypothetical protein
MTLAARLFQAITAAGVPVVSVSIRDPQNRATWTVHPAELQAAAQPIIDAYVLQTGQELLDEEALREVDLRVLKAIVIELHALVPAYAGKPTLAQLRDAILARYKVLNGS